MKIERFIPKPKPEYSMTFTLDEGWAIVAALHDYADRHLQAANQTKWKQWAIDLDGVLRR